MAFASFTVIRLSSRMVDWLSIVIPPLASGAIGITTALVTARLAANAERRKFERDYKSRIEEIERAFATKYAELKVANPEQAEAVREQFAGAYLHVQDVGPGVESRFFIPRSARVTIGRRADLKLPDPQHSMSQRHATIQLVGNGAFLDDFHSTNGTLVNGKAVSERVQLYDGDVIQFGFVKTIFRKLAS
jgi:hypothetical protein